MKVGYGVVDGTVAAADRGFIERRAASGSGACESRSGSDIPVLPIQS